MALAFSLVAELRSGRGGQLAVGGTVAAVTVGLFLLPAGGIPSLQAVDRALANDPVTTVSGMVTGENSQFMSDEGASSEFRSAMRALALKEVERRPLLGAGWGTWGFVGEPAMVGVATHPHNDVLLILVEGGLIGALLLYAGVCILWTRCTGPLNPTHYALVVFAGVTAMSSPMLPVARGAAVPLLLMTQWRTPTRVGVDE
jgi:O-antigen ligase